jgi:hypothetical protein
VTTLYFFIFSTSKALYFTKNNKTIFHLKLRFFIFFLKIKSKQEKCIQVRVKKQQNFTDLKKSTTNKRKKKKGINKT